MGKTRASSTDRMGAKQFFCVISLALLLHSRAASIPNCKSCSSYEYGDSAGESYFCQDSNNKCWNSIDCTGVGSLCKVDTSCSTKKYNWIGASAGSDDWCNQNCNHNPSYCPVESCACTTTTDSCSTDTSVCQCPYGPAHQYCVTNADCPSEGSYCMNGTGKVPPFVCHVPNKQLQMTVQLHNVSSSVFGPEHQHVFSQAVWSGIKNYIRTTHSIALNKSDDETHRRSASQTRRKSGTKTCKWIGASAGSDDWCNQNCNHNPPYCPSSSCSCTASKPATNTDYCSSSYPSNNKGKCDKDPKCIWWRGSGRHRCVARTICNPCSSYANLQVGQPSYCQDSNDKCWSSADCTGVGTLCTVGVPTSVPKCCASLCAAAPNVTVTTNMSNIGNSSSPNASSPGSGMVNFNHTCTDDSDCGGDGNYCMNDPTKRKPFVCHTSSVTISFNVSLSNATKDLYNSAGSTLNQYMGNASRRTATTGTSFTTMCNSMAAAYNIANMQISSVSVLAKAQSYDAYCQGKTAAHGCVADSSSTSSSDGGLSTVAIVFIVLGCLMAIAAAIGAVWFYAFHTQKLEAGDPAAQTTEVQGTSVSV